MSGLIDPATGVLEHALDGLTSRQSAISSNLANIDTPGYRPETVDFETQLKREVAAMQSGSASIVTADPSSGPAADSAMRTTDPRHFAAAASAFGGLSGVSSNATDENLRNDSNTVDLETEMTALTETQIKYSAVSKLVTAKLGQLYTVLGGR